MVFGKAKHITFVISNIHQGKENEVNLKKHPNAQRNFKIQNMKL